MSEKIATKIHDQKNIIYNNINNMLKQDLSNLSKEQLINLLLKQNAKIQLLKNKYEPIRPTPAQRKNVKQMVQDYEENIIPPPIEFQDKPISKPRTIKRPTPLPRINVKQLAQDYEKNIITPVPKPRTIKPVALPRTKIEEVAVALKGYTKSFEIGIKHKKDPLQQLQNTRLAVERHIEKLLISMKGIKFVETLRVTSKKMVNDEIVYDTAYFNSKPQTITNQTEILAALQKTQEEILNMIAQSVANGSNWIIESVDNHYLNIVQYQPMKGSSYIKLPEELRHHMKGLINMKNEDNECFGWCHIRFLNPQDKDHSESKNPTDLTSIN